MEKMLKITAMIFVIAAVVFAAGCAGKTNTGEENKASETPASAVTPASTETPASAVTPVVPTENVTENLTENVTENVMENATANVTEKTTAPTGTRISNAQRKLLIAQNHTKSSGSENVSENASA
jgi:inhibitor of cysteine peptidase